MHDLIQKTRRINKYMLRSAGQPLNLDELSYIFSDSLDASVLLVDYKGHFLAAAKTADCPVLPEDSIPREFNNELLDSDGILSNVSDPHMTKAAGDLASGLFQENSTTIIPIVAGAERLGTLMMVRKTPFADEDLLIGEYCATIVGVELLRNRVYQQEARDRDLAVVKMALDTLSYSEQEAVEHIFQELGGREGVLVASKIADRVGITRSVIVNALRKFESAAVIESRSLGMKGTFIRVINPQLLPELERVTNR